MPIDFPNSPSNGQEHTVGSTTWVYDGAKWNIKTVNAVSNDSMPVGAIMWFGGSSTPTAWLLCNGAAVSRSTYANLFAVVGTTYGSGDGSTTFNLPNISSTTGAYYIRFTTSVGVVSTTALATAPVGTMFDWPTTSSYPTGFLRADGSAVSRTTYADLFVLCGTTYGAGDNSTTFNLPNLPAAGAGSPVKIIKATNSGVVEPSTVAHAGSHTIGGGDAIAIRQSQITDYIFTTEAARDAAITSPVEGMTAYLTAPTVPAATGNTTTVPTGIQTIYNGTAWVCVTEVGAYTDGSIGVVSSAGYTTTGSGTHPNPTVTLNTGSTALVSFSAACFNNSSAFWARLSVGVTGASTITSDTALNQWNENLYTWGSAGALPWTASKTFVIFGLTPGINTFSLRYLNANASTANFTNRFLTVKGVT